MSKLSAFSLSPDRDVALSLLERRADRVIADAADLARSVADQLQTLPPEERRLMQRQSAAAAADLETLLDELEGELSALASDLHAVTLHTGAATAYRRLG